ncbi:uncharacterized protein LOC108228813 [Kryptolebias marmoratus]|uniref:uncharacterized protein LOC108228813 n=1 Tax=Kryptolebias marmoratus TaxID=37003 RepID=UPI0018ACE524|nr:uncharacterized protein LOC108228813 [Kryptolebias marmoratus]
MAQINSCLKRLFIGFNLLFAILGGVFIALAMLSQAYTSSEEEDMVGNRTTGLVLLYVVGAGTMLISLLGAYGAYREHRASLIVFLVFMIIGALLMIRTGIPSLIVRPQFIPGFCFGLTLKCPLCCVWVAPVHLFTRSPVHLFTSAPDRLGSDLETLNPLEEFLFPVRHPDVCSCSSVLLLWFQMHCCGLFSYQDWNKEFPDSCLCPPTEEESECVKVDSYVTRVESYVKLPFSRDMGSKLIYSQPCFPGLMHYISLGYNLVIGFIFTLASLAVLGMILSSIMIHQLRFRSRPTVLLGVPTVFTPSLPKYQELQNPPPKYEEVQNFPPPPPPAY